MLALTPAFNDSTLFSIGIEIVLGGIPYVYEIIKKNEVLPTFHEFTFRIPYDDIDVIRTYIYIDTSLPDRMHRIGEIEMHLDDYFPRENDRVMLKVEMNEEGCLKLTFTMPDSLLCNQYIKEISIQK